MTVVTLTTNLGYGNNEIGIIVGEILTKAPEVKIADLTHDLNGNEILDAAVILNRHSSYFPAGTVHMVSIINGNMKRARPIASKIGEQYFVGPDNGFLTLLIRDAEIKNRLMKFIHINNPEFWSEEINRLNNDIYNFAKVSGYLAAGEDLDKLGTKIVDPVLLNIPLPKRSKNGWTGSIMHIDHFGNLESNIHAQLLEGMKIKRIRCCSFTTDSFVQTFGDASPGDLVAMIDSSGVVSICQVNGSAANTLNCGVGETIEILCDKFVPET